MQVGVLNGKKTLESSMDLEMITTFMEDQPTSLVPGFTW